MDFDDFKLDQTERLQYVRMGTALCGRIEMAFDGGMFLRTDWEGRYMDGWNGDF